MLTRTLVHTEVYFGSTHPLTLQLVSFLRTYSQRETELEEYLPRQGERHLLTYYLVRYVQLRYSAWIATQWRTSEVIEVPNFLSLFQQMDFGESWEPTFPFTTFAQHQPLPLEIELCQRKHQVRKLGFEEGVYFN